MAQKTTRLSININYALTIGTYTQHIKRKIEKALLFHASAQHKLIIVNYSSHNFTCYTEIDEWQILDVTLRLTISVVCI